MDSTLPTDPVLRDAGMLVENTKATKQMKRSISEFASHLTCPLCSKIFDRPATLSACGHTFCMICIDAYSSNNCTCPAEGCGMPLSIIGGGGSFRKPNLQIAQTIESLQLIVKSLNLSEEKWWASPDTLQSIKAMKASRNQDEQEDSSEPESDDRVGYTSDTSDKEDNSSDGEEEMIDLQAN
mmetsp:Transcript_19309/g.48065  ORF Transcript_19309/g.48065 Transcript_19309/m.48065 type:complete len:182 (-) Transcript_19309:300-845(-)